jgi:serine/threonine protein kinase
MIGTTLKSRYKIIELLGSGGFGETYIAEDLDIPTDPKPRCVVKRLQPDVIDPTVIRLFEQEAQLLYNLGKNHEQIPSLNAYFLENNEFYLVQDLIIGHDLSQEIIQGKKLSEDYVIKLLQDVLTVLSYVHNNDVIHRDIKPQNIIRRQSDGKLILIDFGAVKEVKQKTILQSGVTSKTITIGTPGYMPSEQAIGRPKFSSDVYALGMIAIQALTGKFPTELPEDHHGEIIWENLVNINAKLANIITKMVKYHFRDRYQNAGEVLQALNQDFSSLTLSAKPDNIILQTLKADYHKLDELLAAKKWKEADQETANIMFKIMNRDKEGFLQEDDCKKFPKDELKILDNLWRNHSNGHFGFTVQKQIFTSVKIGGKKGKYEYDIWRKFGDEVGWRKEEIWLSNSEFSSEILASKKGQFPWLWGWLWVGLGKLTNENCGVIWVADEKSKYWRYAVERYSLILYNL